MNKLITTIFLLTISISLVFTQQVEKPQDGLFLLKNGRIETLDKGLIKADILLDEGVIKDISSSISHPGAQTINCSGLLIYPGLIDAGTRLGLSEVGAVSLTQDHNEIGDFTPHMEALTAINPSSVNIPVTRVNGVTMVLSVPSGGKLPGTASAINLHGYTPKQMDAGFKGMICNFPSTGKRGRRDRRSEEDIIKDDKKARKALDDFFAKAKLYAQIAKKGDSLNLEVEYNPQLAAMVPVLNGEIPLMVEVNKKRDILNAINWIKDKKMNVIFTGVAEGYKVTDSLAKYNIPVITGPILANPSRTSDRYDIAYSNAGKMHKAGIKVAIRTKESENVRNLPYNAGFAATYGMGWKEAFRAITINPAEMFGIDDKYGSIERGKVANLFVTDGDPFETKTQVKYLFIKGWNIPLESRHTLLNEEYLNREP